MPRDMVGTDIANSYDSTNFTSLVLLEISVATWPLVNVGSLAYRLVYISYLGFCLIFVPCLCLFTSTDRDPISARVRDRTNSAIWLTKEIILLNLS